MKDKTFFFVAYQETRERNGTSPTYSLGTTAIPEVLTPEVLTNDRSTTTLTFGRAECGF